MSGFGAHRYGWFNTQTQEWELGDKELLNYLRNSGVTITNVTSAWCKTKKATIKFEKSILDKNRHL